MKLEWLEDLLAVIETGSLNDASKKRYLTQPAFTRRIQTIERYIGVDLFDRSNKPLRVKESVIRNEEKIRQIVRSLREITSDLKMGDNVEKLLVLGCQHSISTAVAPKLVKALSNEIEAKVRLRSANRDECYSLLLSGEADIVLMYRTLHELSSQQTNFLDIQVVGEDELIPVVASAIKHRAWEDGRGAHLDIVGYPEGVFLGKLFQQQILPKMAEKHTLRIIAETALTPAALQFAISSVGVAWVPRSLAQNMLDSAVLVDLSDSLPSASMQICAVQLKKQTDLLIESAWKLILSDRITLP